MESKEEKAEATNLGRIASPTMDNVAGRMTMGKRGSQTEATPNLKHYRRWAIQIREKNGQTQGHTRYPSNGQKKRVPTNNKTHMCPIAFL